MQIRSVGIDLGKTTCHLVALADNGKVLLKKKFTQKQLIAFTANIQTCLIGMEACSGSHFLHRVCERLMARITALINQIRAFLLERGIVFAKSPIRLREALPEVLENTNEDLTPRMRTWLQCCGTSGKTWNFRSRR